eukprot:1447569-Pyramimonas_sp.AAC.1
MQYEFAYVVLLILTGTQRFAFKTAFVAVALTKFQEIASQIHLVVFRRRLTSRRFELGTQW